MKQKLEQLLAEQNWGTDDFVIQEVPTPALISAGIEDRGKWHIEIQVDKQINQLDNILARFQNTGFFPRFSKRKNYFTGKDNLGNLLYFIVGHEVGHWRYCPFHIDNREDIVSGVAEGLAEIGFTQKQIKQHSQRVYNYFADILDNVMSMYRDRQKEKFRDGFLAFYTEQGVITGRYTEDFFIFVDAIARLGVDEQAMKKFAANFTKKHEELERETEEVIKILIEDNELAKKVIESETTFDEKVSIYHALDDKEKWHDKAKEFAKLIGKYMRKQEQYKNQLSNESGGHGSSQEQQEIMRELIKKSIEKGHFVGYAPIGVALDEVYKQRAEQLLIKMQEEKGESFNLPIAYLQRKPLEAGADMNNVDWQNPELVFDADGNEELEFFEKRVSLPYNEEGPEKGTRVPDILFLIDTSGSMIRGYDPAAGTGPYDMLLRSVWSVFKQLEDKEMIQHMNFGVLLFEGKPNYFSGWHSYYEMDELKEVLLNPIKYHHGPFLIGSGTDLDARVIQNAVDASEGKFWAITVSDGAIGNLDEACNAMSYIAGKGHNLSFMKMGYWEPYSTVFGTHIKNLNGDVHQAATPEDIPKIILGKAEEIYEV